MGRSSVPESSKTDPSWIHMVLYARVMSVICLILGLLGLIGWATGIEEIQRVKPEYFPIAPGSSLMIVLLSLMILTSLVPRERRLVKTVTLTGTSFVVAFSAWLTIAYFLRPSFDLEASLFGHGSIESGIQISHMSPVAAGGYLALGLGLLIVTLGARHPYAAQLSVFLGGGASMVGLVGVLGYAYGSPLLYGSPTRPLALTATISLSLLGFALICSVGPRPWPANTLVGQSVKARLLRVFPLITAATVLVICWLFRQTEGSGNPAIVASLIALASTIVVVLVVSKVAEVIGGEVDSRNIELKAAEESLRALNDQLEARTVELSAVNKELESFSYSVSHDLRAPLTHIDGYASIISMDYAKNMDEKGKEYVSRLRASAKRMNDLIDDLLQLSRVSKSEMQVQTVNLSELAEHIMERLRADDPGRKVTFSAPTSAPAEGDSKLFAIVLENLLGNSWKFTSKKEEATIEFGVQGSDGKTIYYIRDDGAGFDPQHKDRLFTPFQRLHSISEFPGTGIGLATVRRIIARHGGEIWAEGEIGKGATFYFTLGETRPAPEGNQSETMSST